MRGFSWKNIAIYGGVTLVALAILDTALDYQRGSGFGRGLKTQATEEAALVFLMLGTIIGMLAGISMAFGYFIWKEKKLEAEPDQISQLLDELSREEALLADDPNSSESGEDKGDRLEPWERPTDWWKSEED